MPELPEVETIKRALEKTIVHKRIIDVVVNDAYVIKEPSIARFRNGLKNSTITRILRKGKALIVELSCGKFLIVHLRMTGQLVYPGNGVRSRVRFLLSDKKTCDYNDRRRLGELRLVSDWRSIPFFARLGQEPDELRQHDFSHILAKRKTKIKPLLMDQRFIAGIGNIYAAEVLFKAKIHPLRPASTLSECEKKRLLFALRSIMTQAIKHRGSSIDQYVTVSGKRGDFSRFHNVYDREGESCPACNASIKRITQGGRGTYFCGRCQK